MPNKQRENMIPYWGTSPWQIAHSLWGKLPVCVRNQRVPSLPVAKSIKGIELAKVKKNLNLAPSVLVNPGGVY